MVFCFRFLSFILCDLNSDPTSNGRNLRHEHNRNGMRLLAGWADSVGADATICVTQ